MVSKVAEKFGAQRVAVFAITGDRDIKNTQRILKKVKVSVPILHDKESKVFKAYRANAIPTLYLIDQQGKIYTSWIGAAEQLESELTQNIEFVLKAGSILPSVAIQTATAGR